MMKRFNYKEHCASLIIILLLTGVSGFINAQTSSVDSSPQYLYPEFSSGIVKMKNGRNQKAMLNYNMVSEKMVYQQGDKLFDLMGTEMVDTVFLQNSCFIPVSEVFYEVVVVAPISLFIQHQGSIIPPGRPSGYGGTSQTSSISSYSGINTASGYHNLKLPSDYTVNVDPVYWIRTNNEIYSFTNERQFLKIFPEQADELKQFIKKGRIKIARRDDLIRLINYSNELLEQ